MEEQFHMEKDLVINNKEINYNGRFKVEELFSLINSCLEERDYHKKEKKSEEKVTTTGRNLYLELRPVKDVSNYVILMIKIKIYLENIKDEIKEVKGIKKTFQKGNLRIVFDAWSLTDYEHRWIMKPIVWFTKAMIHKFIYRFPLEEGFKGQLVGDTAFIYGRIKKLLNSYENKEKKVLDEEEVKKLMQEKLAISKP